MRFSTCILPALACATGVIADLHYYGSCMDVIIKGFNQEYKENTDATEKACAMYRQRNTGNKQWDKCPDCKTSARGDVVVCNSLGKHIGGDEWNYYCRKAGADRSSAD